MEKEAFNIRVGYGKKEVTLTILKEKDYYKVIYFGGIMGAVRHDRNEWVLMKTTEIPAGDLPVYTPELKGERLEIVFDEHTARAIGKEIEYLIY